MKRLSIKQFSITLLIIFILYQMISFGYFYKRVLYSINSILFENLKTDSVILKENIEKNIRFADISNIAAFLGTYSATHPLIDKIYLLNESKKPIFSTDRDISNFSLNKRCLNLRKLSADKVLDIDCFYMKVKVYKKLTPYFYYAYIIIDKKYQNSLFKTHLLNYIVIFIISNIFFGIFLIFVINKFIITPLEQLRQYAYYSNKPLQSFLINEFESIRYSLKNTFHRLKSEQYKFYELSTKDPLTKLLNRNSLIKEVDRIILESNRLKQNFTFLFMDIDDFKLINDTYGHDFGDKVLISISKKLKNSVRKSDIVARFGGDEFVIILLGASKPFQIKKIIEKIQKNMKIPIKKDEASLTPTFSIGIAFYPKDGKDFHELLKNADIAMYKAKNSGKNIYHFFSLKDENKLLEKIKIEQLIKKALKENNFKLYYQPQVDIKTNKIVGCEALIRLIDPIEGLIPPDKFIPVAEETNQIIQIGRWVFQESIRQIKEWEKSRLRGIKVSVNISALELNDEILFQYIKNSMKVIDAKNLCIELTESVFIDYTENNIEKINLGISLALDDFGTGYSSLSYVKNLPFNYLKIDKSFIDDILKDPQDKIFIKVIIDMAKTMKLKTIAEGVETKEQRDILKEFGCDIYQGYLSSKPLPAKDFENFFLEWNKES